MALRNKAAPFAFIERQIAMHTLLKSKFLLILY